MNTMSNMKKILQLLCLSAMAIVVAACGEKTDDAGELAKLKLTINKSIVQANSDDYVEVTVSNADGVITEGLIFIDKKSNKQINVVGGKFYPEKAGEYTFLASDGVSSFSDYVTVLAIDHPVPVVPEDAEPDKFVFNKKTLIVQFTSSACVACPTMKTVLNEMLEDEVYRNKCVIASSHHDMDGVKDPASYVGGANFEAKLGVSTYPKLVLDYRSQFELYSGQTISQTVNKLKSDVDRLNENGLSPAGIAVNSNGTDLAVVARTLVKVGAEDDGRWYVGAYLLQDGISGRQAPTNEETVYDNCIRAIEAGANYYGYSLGVMSLGETAEHTFVFNKFESNVDVDNCKLLVYVKCNDVVQNAVVVPIGENVGFDYASVN